MALATGAADVVHGPVHLWSAAISQSVSVNWMVDMKGGRDEGMRVPVRRATCMSSKWLETPRVWRRTLMTSFLVGAYEEWAMR